MPLNKKFDPKTDLRFPIHKIAQTERKKAPPPAECLVACLFKIHIAHSTYFKNDIKYMKERRKLIKQFASDRNKFKWENQRV